MEWDDPIDLFHFRSSVDDPHHRPDPYALRELWQCLDSFVRKARQLGIDDDFIRRIRQAILDGFRRLDALPRDDPFWEGTNRRPTLVKFPRFCTKLLEDDPRDYGALWTLAADAIVSYQGVNPRFWLSFIPAGGLDPCWPIYAAVYVPNFEIDRVKEFVSVLDEAGLRDAAQPILGQLALSGCSFVREWATSVSAACMGLDLRDLIFRIERTFGVRILREELQRLIKNHEMPDIQVEDLYDFILARAPQSGLFDIYLDAEILWAMYQARRLRRTGRRERESHEGQVAHPRSPSWLCGAGRLSERIRAGVTH